MCLLTLLTSTRLSTLSATASGCFLKGEDMMMLAVFCFFFVSAVWRTARLVDFSGQASQGSGPGRERWSRQLSRLRILRESDEWLLWSW